MAVSQLLLVLRSRWWVVALVFAAVVLVVGFITLTSPKMYTATATVLVNARQTDPVSGNAQPAAFLPSYMITEVDVMNSDRVARRAVERLGLNHDRYLQQQWRDTTGGQGAFDMWLADRLQDSLDVRPSRDSNIVYINFTGRDPEFAAAVANAFADSYLETNLRLRVEPARQYATWFVNQSKQLRKNLAEAQARLSAYQRKNGLVGINGYDVENARLGDISAALSAARAQKAGSMARRHQATGDMANSPEVLGSPIVQSLRTQVVQKAAELKEVSSYLGPQHPHYQEVRSQLNELQARLNSEMGHAASAVSAATRVDTQREAELSKALEDQRRKVVAMSAERDTWTVLLRDVENAQRAYEAVGQRLNQSTLEGEIKQTEVSVLAPAMAPSEPSGPNVTLNLLLAVMTGGFLGVVAALVVELNDRRVRSEDDLGHLVSAPIMATVEKVEGERSGGSRWENWLRQRSGTQLEVAS